MLVSIIVAVAKNGVIGKDNQLIWRLSDDLKNFRKLTTGHAVIMGRKTYDSIGKPLPNRVNIVISRQKDLEIEGCVIANSFENALEKAQKLSEKEEVFIIGGENIYNQALSIADKLYYTVVNVIIEGDAFFPKLDKNQWNVINRTQFSANEKNEYNFEVIEMLKK